MSDIEHSRREYDKVLNQRLEGIETEMREMRKLSERVVVLQERFAAHIETSNKQDVVLASVITRISAIELDGAKGSISLAWIERVFWIAAASISSYVFSMLKH